MASFFALVTPALLSLGAVGSSHTVTFAGWSAPTGILHCPRNNPRCGR